MPIDTAVLQTGRDGGNLPKGDRVHATEGHDLVVSNRHHPVVIGVTAAGRTKQKMPQDSAILVRLRHNLVTVTEILSSS